MASGVKVYQRLLQEHPIDECETVLEYARRLFPMKDDYGITSTTVKAFAGSIRDNLDPNRQVKIKRSETLQGGVVTTERYGFVKDREEVDKSQMRVIGLTENPNGADWVRYKPMEVDYLAEIKAIFGNLKLTPVKKFIPTKSQKALKVTLSDMHVGMSVKNSLFEYKYGAEEFNNSLNAVYTSIMEEHSSNGKFDVVILQDLGDGLDGYNGQTTRGGHSLEQNMSNAEAFRTYVNGKIDIISKIYRSGVANQVWVRDTVNCNHSGDFGYMANYAIKLACEAMFSDIQHHIHERFIEHFFYGEHCFIQTHGKDKLYMKSGMPLKLDDRTQKFISQYIDKNQIKSKYIHFEKGDLHQIGFNKCKQFDYRNFMSFAPPSNWVQHNFGDGYSGYSLQVIEPERREIKHIDCFLDYEV